MDDVSRPEVRHSTYFQQGYEHNEGGISAFSFEFSTDIPNRHGPVIPVEPARGWSENFAVDRKLVRPRPLPV